MSATDGYSSESANDHSGAEIRACLSAAQVFKALDDVEDGDAAIISDDGSDADEGDDTFKPLRTGRGGGDGRRRCLQVLSCSSPTACCSFPASKLLVFLKFLLWQALSDPFCGSSSSVVSGQAEAKKLQARHRVTSQQEPV